MRYLVVALVLVSVFSIPPVRAQAPPSENAIVLPGKVGVEGAQAIALRAVPGVVIETSAYKDDDDFYHVITVRRSDDTIYEVVIYGATGNITRKRIVRLGADAALPPPAVSEEQARKTALAHVQALSSMTLKPRIKNMRYGLSEGASGVPVYEVEVKRTSKSYRVVIDAHTGAVLSAKRSD